MKKLLLNNILGLTLVLCCVSIAHSAMPITTDSRIKTFVYNENEVFHITVQYGYQSNVEFAKGEEVETISIGNSYSWKITPVGRRLFIKALEGAARTNMTVITNKHTYQIELESKYPNQGFDADLVYVVRFYYPSENFDKPLPTMIAPKIDPTQYKPELIKRQSNYNFNYSLTGPDSIAPVKVFDDGTQTFLQFTNHNSVIPHIFIVDQEGKENRTTFSRQGDYIVIKQLIDKLALRMNQDVVFVFNES